MTRPELSVVIPVYGCAGCLAALHERLHASLDSSVGDWEVVYVDDASPDGVLGEARGARPNRPPRAGARLSRNFGQHAAITAGLAESRGRWTAVMDCDLEDRPEELPRMLRLARSAAPTSCSRAGTPTAGVAPPAPARTLLPAPERSPRDEGRSRARDAERRLAPVVDAFLSMGDRDRHYILILHWLGFRRRSRELEPGERHEGHSSYSLRKLMGVAMDGMFFQTTALLRWITYRASPSQPADSSSRSCWSRSTSPTGRRPATRALPS